MIDKEKEQKPNQQIFRAKENRFSQKHKQYACNHGISNSFIETCNDQFLGGIPRCYCSFANFDKQANRADDEIQTNDKEQNSQEIKKECLITFEAQTPIEIVGEVENQCRNGDQYIEGQD